MSKVTKHILKNGLKVYFVNNTNAESVAIQLRGFAGSNYELSDEIGVAHFTEHFLLKGTEKYPKESDLLGLITNDGGKYVAITSRDDVLFGVHILPQNLEKGLEFVSQLFYKPIFDKKHLSTLKTLITTEISRYYDSPEKLLSRVAYKTIFPNTRMAQFNTGSVKHISRITYDKIVRFYSRVYRNSNFILVICGHFSQQETFNYVKHYFSVINKPISLPKIFLLPKIANKRSRKIVTQLIKYKGLVQSYLRIDYPGFTYNNGNNVPALLSAKYLNTILNQKLKRGQGLVYKLTVDSFSSINFGVFSIFLAIPKENIKSVAEIVTSTINSECNSINSDILEHSKNSLVTNLVFMLEKTSLRAEFFSESFLYQTRLTINPYTKLRTKISKTRAETIRTTLLKVFAYTPRVTVVGDVSKSYLNNTIKTLQYIHV